MVQVISPSPRAMQAGQIGQALGIGIGKNFPDPQQLVQRKQLSEAFQQFQNQSKDPNASPLDLSMNFLQSMAGIPGSERYVGQILPLIISQANAQRGAQTPQPGMEGGSPQMQGQQQPAAQITGSPSTQYVQKTQQEIPNFPPPDQETPNVFGNTLEPTQLGMGPLPKTYSPQQIQQMETEDLRAGFPQSIRAQRAKEHNELARQEIKDYVNAAQVQSTIASQRRESQQQFRESLKEYYGNDPLSLSLAENISNRPEYQNIANDQIRAEKVKREVDLLGKNIEGYKRASVRPSPYGYRRSVYNKNFESLNENAQPLIKEGLRPELQKILAENGWTGIEVEQILNPLGQKNLTEIKSLPSLDVSKASTAGGGVLFSGSDQKIINERKKSWEKSLEKLIKPGEINPRTRDTLKPGTSLVLLRDQFMKKGGNWQDFEDMILNMRSNGKIKLDKYQEDEMNKLSQPPFQTITLDEFFNGTKDK